MLTPQMKFTGSNMLSLVQALFWGTQFVFFCIAHKSALPHVHINRLIWGFGIWNSYLIFNIVESSLECINISLRLWYWVSFCPCRSELPAQRWEAGINEGNAIPVSGCRQGERHELYSFNYHPILYEWRFLMMWNNHLWELSNVQQVPFFWNSSS